MVMIIVICEGVFVGTFDVTFVLGRSPYLHIAATDILSVSCQRSNTGFRWLYSGERVSNDTIEYGGNIRYSCIHVTHTGFYAAPLAVVVGRGLCELTF